LDNHQFNETATDGEQFVEDMINATSVHESLDMVYTYFLPNAKGGPTILLQVSHDLIDGEGLASLIR
jgi:hypothetical protein